MKRFVLPALALMFGCVGPPEPPEKLLVVVPGAPRTFIEVDPSRLQAHALTMDNFLGSLRGHNIAIISCEGTRAEVRAADPESLRRLVVGTREGIPITVRDLAQIEVRR